MYFNKTYIDIVKDKNYICRELEQYFKKLKRYKKYADTISKC